VLVEDGEEYDRLRGVEIVGRAVIHRDPEPLLTVARDVVRRYFDDAASPMSDDELDAMAAGLATKRVAVEIVPERTVSWDHRKLAGRY
jgi:hypothetical protein